MMQARERDRLESDHVPPLRVGERVPAAEIARRRWRGPAGGGAAMADDIAPLSLRARMLVIAGLAALAWSPLILLFVLWSRWW